MARMHQDQTEKCCKPRSARRAAGQATPRSIQSTLNMLRAFYTPLFNFLPWWNVN